MTLPYSRFHQKYIHFFLLASVVVFGFLLRIQVITYTVVDTPVRADARQYVLYAYNLRQSGTYSYGEEGILGHPEQLVPDAFRTPGYPLFLSLFMGKDFTGAQYYTVLLQQVILSTLTIILGYFLAVGLGRFWALTVAFLIACSPHLVSTSTYLLTETLFCFWLTAFLALSIRLKVDTPPLWFFLSGLLLGLATLTRPWTQDFIVPWLIFLALFLTGRQFNRPLSALIGFMVIIAPWIIRNYWVLGMASDPKLFLSSLQISMYPDLMYNAIPETKGYPYRFDPWVKTAVMSFNTIIDELFRRISESPWVYLKWYLWGKIHMLFSWDLFDGGGDVFIYPVVDTPYAKFFYFKLTHSFMKITHPLWVGLSLIGSILAWLPLTKKILQPHALFAFRLLSFLMLYFIAVHVILITYPRYSIPVRPVTYSLAVLSLVVASRYFTEWLREKRFTL